MKKCAKCGERYDDEYDGCPACADDPYSGNPWLNPVGCMWTVIVLVVVIGLVIWLS